MSVDAAFRTFRLTQYRSSRRAPYSTQSRYQPSLSKSRSSSLTSVSSISPIFLPPTFPSVYQHLVFPTLHAALHNICYTNRPSPRPLYILRSDTFAAGSLSLYLVYLHLFARVSPAFPHARLLSFFETCSSALGITKDAATNF